MDDIDQRLRRIESRLELAELVNDYFLALDGRDYDRLAPMFTTRARFGPVSGRDAVIDYLREKQRTYTATIHSGHGLVICELSDEVARGVTPAHCEIGTSEGTFFGALRYDDSFAFEDGRWRFHQRTVTFSHLGRWEESGRSLTDSDRVRGPGSPPRSGSGLGL